MNSMKCSSCKTLLTIETAAPSIVKRGNGYCSKCSTQYRSMSRKRDPEKTKQVDKQKAAKNFKRNQNRNPYFIGGMKVCPRCNHNWPIEFFSISRYSSTGLNTYCKLCDRKRTADGNGQSYDITSQEYVDLLIKQDCKCAICKKEKGFDLAIDHDHKTGQIRGLLCFDCNTGIGKLGDNVKFLENSITYLKGATNATRNERKTCL